MFGDGGSLWIALVHDRDELQEEGDELAQMAVVTLVVTMVVAAFIYFVMLWYYASRIGNLRRTLRSIQTASPEASTDLVDDFVDNSRIHEVHQIADEFGSVIHAAKYSKGSRQSTGGVRAPVYVGSHLWDSSEVPVVTKLLADATAFIPGAKVAFHAPDALTKQVGKPAVGGKEYVVISVTDFGRGIPEKKLVKLFSPFAQMRTEDSECGAGLGLNMCFHVAILLGDSLV